MAKKKEEKIEEKKKKSSSGSALKGLGFIFGKLFRIILFILSFFGLWIPAVYAVFGLVLHIAFNFDPFNGRMESILYLIGFSICAVLALAVSIKNLFINPYKNIAKGYKDFESKSARKKQGARAPFPKEEYEPRETHSRRRASALEHLPDDYDPSEKSYCSGDTRVSPDYNQKSWNPPKERPKIYFSKKEADTLIHEYCDRFEVFRIKDGKASLYKVEYKDNEF